MRAFTVALVFLFLALFSRDIFAQKMNFVARNMTAASASAIKPTTITESRTKNKRKKKLTPKSQFDKVIAPSGKIDKYVFPERLSRFDSLYIQSIKKNSLKSYARFVSALTKTNIEYKEKSKLGDMSASDEATPDDSLFFSQDGSVLVLSDDAEYDLHQLPYTPDFVVRERLQKIKNAVPLTFNEETRLYIDFYSTKLRPRVSEIMKRSYAYFPLFEETLAEYGMPDELKYLAVIESALLPTVRSRAGALGLWQFMPVTGKKFGLPMNYYFDERCNPVKATRAACELLDLLYKMFGDWELALAAYNCGPGTVKKVQKKTGKNGFWEIYDHLPAETRGYVPSFVAAMYCFEFREELNFNVTEKHIFIPTEIVAVNRPVNLTMLAQELKMCPDDLKALNPQLLRNIIPHTSKPYELNVPKNRATYFRENYDQILANAATSSKAYSNEPVIASKSTSKYSPSVLKDGAVHIVNKGETLGHIALQYNTSVRKLMEINNLHDHRIRVGQKLQVYTDGSGSSKNEYIVSGKNPVKSNKPNDAVASKDNKITSSDAPKTNNINIINSGGAGSNAKGSVGIVHTVVSGDSLWKIARKYNTTVEALKKANNLTSEKLNLGQKIVIR
jgi:membrane-bound lytic murein transglycosylase D